MCAGWGRVSVIIVLYLFFWSKVSQCLETSIVESMGNSKWCERHNNKIQWISEKTSALITGKGQGEFKPCNLTFGLATKNGNARLKLNFDFIYIHDCGVQLQINQSFTSDFSLSTTNNEMFLSRCNMLNPGPLYAQPKQFVLISLQKENNAMEAYNFRLNISMAEQLPVTGLDLHVVIIVGFVLVVVVGMAAVLLFKYVTRLSYSWHEQRVEAAMTRAINIYNSQEPLEEPDMVYIRPGDHDSSAVSRPVGSEIAFVHSNGRVERFRPLHSLATDRRESATKVKRTKADTRKFRSPDPPLGSRERDERSACSHSKLISVDSMPSRVRKECVDQGETISLGGCDIPPSYEEALEMPVFGGGGTNFPEAEDSENALEGEGLAVGGRLELEYMNFGVNDIESEHISKKDREDDSQEALLSYTKQDPHS